MVERKAIASQASSALKKIKIEAKLPVLDEIRNFAVAGLACMIDELRGSRLESFSATTKERRESLLEQLRRSAPKGILEPPFVRVPAGFQELFGKWVSGQASFVEVHEK